MAALERCLVWYLTRQGRIRDIEMAGDGWAPKLPLAVTNRHTHARLGDEVGMAMVMLLENS